MHKAVQEVKERHVDQKVLMEKKPCARSKRKACGSESSDGKDKYRKGVPPVEIRDMKGKKE